MDLLFKELLLNASIISKFCGEIKENQKKNLTTNFSIILLRTNCLKLQYVIIQLKFSSNYEISKKWYPV